MWKLTILAGLARPALSTDATPTDTVPVPVTIPNLALGFRDVTLDPLPSIVTVTESTAVSSVTAAEDGAKTWENKQIPISLD